MTMDIDSAGPPGDGVLPARPEPAGVLSIANWQAPQNVKRSFQNIARIHPTIRVSRGHRPIVKLPLAEEKLGKLQVAKSSFTDPALTALGVIHATNTDAVLVNRFRVRRSRATMLASPTGPSRSCRLPVASGYRPLAVETSRPPRLRAPSTTEVRSCTICPQSVCAMKRYKSCWEGTVTSTSNCASPAMAAR